MATECLITLGHKQEKTSLWITQFSPSTFTATHSLQSPVSELASDPPTTQRFFRRTEVLVGFTAGTGPAHRQPRSPDFPPATKTPPCRGRCDGTERQGRCSAGAAAAAPTPPRRGPSTHQELCPRKWLRLDTGTELVSPAPILASPPPRHGPGRAPDRGRRSCGNPRPSHTGTRQTARPTHGSAGTGELLKAFWGGTSSIFTLSR